MSEYNCRVKRVVPKDHVFLVITQPIRRVGYDEQKAFTATVMGTTLCFVRRRGHNNPGKGWSKWYIQIFESYWQGALCSLGRHPNWWQISNVLHYRPQEQT